MAAFYGLSAPMNAVKKNVPTGRLGGGRGTVVKPSPVGFFNGLETTLILVDVA
jgi:hypothetical protein